MRASLTVGVVRYRNAASVGQGTRSPRADTVTHWLLLFGACALRTTTVEARFETNKKFACLRARLKTIGEVARRAGVATSAIRYYERVGLLPPADRVSGQRRYGEETTGHLAFIAVAQNAGFCREEASDGLGARRSVGDGCHRR